MPIPDHIWGAARRERVHDTYRDVLRNHDFMPRGFVNAIVNDTPVERSFRDGARIQRYRDAAG